MAFAAPLPRFDVETEWDLNPGAAGTERWRRVTSLVREFTVTRGRSGALDKIGAGKLEIRLDNSDRRFETGYAGYVYNRGTNPSLETNANGWTNLGGATAGRTNGASSAGQYSYSVARTGALVQIGDGVRIVNADTSRIPVTGSEVWTVSIGAYSQMFTPVNAAWKLQLLEYNAGGTLIRTTDGTAAASALNTRVRRAITVTTLPTTATVAIQVVFTEASGTTGFGLNVDAAMVVPGTDMVYVDGDSEDGRWEGTVHASRTFRGAPYYPNVRPMRRIRIVAVHGNGAADSSLETLPKTTPDDPTTADAWIRATTNVTRVSTPTPQHGSFCYRGEATTGPVYPTFTTASRYRIPITPGESIVVSAYLRKPAAGANPRATVELNYYDITGAFVSGIQVIGQIDPPDNAWQRYVSTAKEVPPYAYYASLTVKPVNTPSAVATVCYVDAIQLDFAAAVTDYSAGVGPQTIFRGFIERFPQYSPSHRRGEVTLTAVDGMAVLAGDEYTGSPPSEGTTARITRLLDDISWPAGLRKLDAGTQTLGAETNLKTQNLTHMQDVAETELGLFFIDGPGFAVLHDKNHRTTNVRSTISQAVFGDGAEDPSGQPGNLVGNDSFETDAGGWGGAVGGETVVQDSERKFGVASLAVTTVASANSGVFNSTAPTPTINVPHIASVWVKAPLGQAMSLYISRGGGFTVGPTVAFVGTDEWQRVEVLFTPATTEAHYINVRHTAATVITFRVDGVYMGAGETVPTELPFLPSILPDQDVADVENEVTATSKAVAAVPQVASDATSIGRYFRRGLSFNTLHSTDAAALTWSQARLAVKKEPPLEIERLEVDPARDIRLWALVLYLEISDRITINRRPQGLALVTFLAFVESISLSVRIDGERVDSRGSWSLSPAP